MSSYMSRVLTQWTSCRIVRLIAGAMLLTEGIRAGDTLFLLVGAVFAGMGLFMVNACYGGACNVPERKEAATGEIVYEEVKPKD